MSPMALCLDCCLGAASWHLDGWGECPFVTAEECASELLFLTWNWVRTCNSLLFKNCKMDLKIAPVMNQLYMGSSTHSSRSWNCLGERHFFYGPLIQFNHVQTSESWHLYNGCPSSEICSNVNARPLSLEQVFCGCHPIPGACFTALFIWRLHKDIVALSLVVSDKSVGALCV